MSAGLERAGPLVIWMDVPSSFGRTVANVVLPSPGGPSKRMWPSGSLSFLDARTAISSRSATFRCPITSLRNFGRRAASCLLLSSSPGLGPITFSLAIEAVPW